MLATNEDINEDLSEGGIDVIILKVDDDESFDTTTGSVGLMQGRLGYSRLNNSTMLLSEHEKLALSPQARFVVLFSGIHYTVDEKNGLIKICSFSNPSEGSQVDKDLLLSDYLKPENIDIGEYGGVFKTSYLRDASLKAYREKIDRSFNIDSSKTLYNGALTSECILTSSDEEGDGVSYCYFCFINRLPEEAYAEFCQLFLDETMTEIIVQMKSVVDKKSTMDFQSDTIEEFITLPDISENGTCGISDIHITPASATIMAAILRAEYLFLNDRI